MTAKKSKTKTRKPKSESQESSGAGKIPPAAAIAGENRADTVSLPIPRDSKGRFQPGCPAGPGRPPKPPEEQNLDLLHEILDEERVRAFITKLYIDSMRGDDEARKLLVRYLLPEPRVLADVRMLTVQANLQATNAEEFAKLNPA